MLGALFLAACGSGQGRGATGDSGRGGATADRGASGAMKVALLTSGPVSDQSWNGGAYQGLLRVRDSLGARVSNIQTKTPSEYEENFRQYGAQGYQLVFGHGFEYQDAADRVASEYPKTAYVVTSGSHGSGNVAALEFDFESGSYLAGMLAGRLTKTGTVGLIGGREFPPVKRSFDAFAAGARAVRPGVKVLTSYIGNWDDVSAGKEQALAQIGQGADVVFQNADAAGLGVFQAAREKPGTLVFGTNSDQNAVAPDVVVASLVIDLPHAFLLVARQVAGGSFHGGVILLGQKEDVVRLVTNPAPAMKARIPAPVVAEIDSVRALQNAGTFVIPGEHGTTSRAGGE